MKDWRPSRYPPGVFGFKWLTNRDEEPFSSTREAFVRHALESSKRLRGRTGESYPSKRSIYYEGMELLLFMDPAIVMMKSDSFVTLSFWLPSAVSPSSHGYPERFLETDRILISMHESRIWEAVRGWYGMYGKRGGSVLGAGKKRNPSLGGEHDEGIWVPGLRFEGVISPDKRAASILDPQHYVHMDGLDLDALKDLVKAIIEAKVGLYDWDPSEFPPERFSVAISKNKRFADIRDTEAKKPGEASLRLLGPENVEELHELVTVLIETLEMAA